MFVIDRYLTDFALKTHLLKILKFSANGRMNSVYNSLHSFLLREQYTASVMFCLKYMIVTQSGKQPGCDCFFQRSILYIDI